MKSETFSRVFSVCILVMRHDVSTVLFLLPYILLHSLLSCADSDVDEIFKEIRNLIDNLQKFVGYQNEEQFLNCAYLIGVDPSSKRHIPLFVDKEDHYLCCKTTLTLLDFLDRWLREWRFSQISAENFSKILPEYYKKISNFVSRVSSLKLAKCSSLCKDYTRALLHLEKYLRDNKQELQSHLPFLQDIYAQLHDVDALSGSLAVQESEPSQYQTIIGHELMGRYEEAILCYEKLGQAYFITGEQLQGLIKCYLSLDLPFIALKLAEGSVYSRPELKDDVISEMCECFWRLSMFDNLTEFVPSTEITSTISLGIHIGQVITLFRNLDVEQLGKYLNKARELVLESLKDSVYLHGSYRHEYSKYLILHILHEVESITTTIFNSMAVRDDSCLKMVEDLISDWNYRFDIIQKDGKAMEQVLCVRRTFLKLGSLMLQDINSTATALINQELGRCWLISAKFARKSNRPKLAYKYLLNAEPYNLPTLFLEKAKVAWQQGEHDVCFRTIRHVLQERFPNIEKMEKDKISKEERIICAKALLLIAKYNDITLKVDANESASNYDRVLSVHNTWEKALLSLGQFYDRIFMNLPDQEKDTSGGDFQLAMINYYGSSLQYSCKYIYQSMPRMLTLWLDYGTRQVSVSKKGESSSTVENPLSHYTKKMCDLLGKMKTILPPYTFMTALSQLISRLCHPTNQVVKLLQSIIVKILKAYPQYTLWMLMSSVRSSYNLRARRCQEILNDSRISDPEIRELIKDFMKLITKLISLTNNPVAQVTETTVTALVPDLNAMLKGRFSKIVIPYEQFLTFVLPNKECDPKFSPFPKENVYISQLLEKVTILPSMQKPRCVTFLGSDGNRYTMLCKPKDDMRKDNRLMELNRIVNKYLQKNSCARQRNLYIRTYSVVPLNEECGVIEWVPNLHSLRATITNIQKQLLCAPPNRILKEYMACKDNARRKEIFLNIISNHKPVLSEWYLKVFPDPPCWYQARTNYIRTCAVMSMVGYIVGLGDRHGENVLLDSSNGGVVHVDFNCLFNKGECFECPEVVPFRLTQNMVDVMGPMGIEGSFRCVCEITLKVLRSESDMLMCVLRPFVYDPTISWMAKAAQSSNKEMTNEKALSNLKRIENRLHGIVRGKEKSCSLPLSAEGQANILIEEATSVDNLSRMYIGWGPYM